MGTGVIEVVDILAHQPSQVMLTENDDVIQTLAPDTANEAFAYSIGFRCAHRCCEDINVAGNTREGGAKLIVIVTDQKPWFFSKRGCSALLLSNPGITRGPCDAKVDHSPRFQLNDEEDEDRAGKYVIGLHKIARPDLTGMVLQEGRPRLPSLPGR
jgi:hypothetical protein